MENNILKKVTGLFFAGVAIIALTVAAGCTGLFTPDVQPAANTRYILQLISIATIASIPLSMKLFSKTVGKNIGKSKEIQIQKYYKASVLRIALIVGGTAISSIIYFMLNDDSSFYCAIVCAAAYIYNYPTKGALNQILDNGNE